MARRAALLAALLVALAPSVATPAAAQEEGEGGPSMTRLSLDPVPGMYTMRVRVDGVTLVAPGAGPANATDQGHLLYMLNGYPCAGACSFGAPSRTNLTSFTYHELLAGDVLVVELLTNAGRSFDPPVRVVANVTATGADCVDRTPTECKRWESRGPLVLVTSGIPNEGDYTMEVRVERFQLAAPGSEPPAPGVGYLRYLLNGAPCTDDCSGGRDAETDATRFTFRGVGVGDRLSAELLQLDGLPFEPPIRATTVVARPSIQAVGSMDPAVDDVPREGNYTLHVLVQGYTLRPPGGEPNPGTGHVVYLVKRQAGGGFVPIEGCGRSPYTAATNFTFCNLKEGDEVTAELVDADGFALDPPVRAAPLEVLRLPEEPYLSPGVGPVLAFALLGLAALRRRR